MPSEVSRLDLELLALGQLPPDRAAVIRTAALEDEDLARRITSVERAIERASEDMPSLVLEPEPQPVETRRRWWMWFAAPLPVMAAAAAALLMLQPDPPPTVTFRGDMDVQLWRVRHGEAVEQGALVEAKAGDRLQWTVEVSEPGWFAVYDVQDDGQVSVFSQPMEVAGVVEGAVVLDDYAGSERLYFTLSDEPFAVEAVELAVEASWKVPISDLDALPLDGAQRSVLVIK